MVIGWRFAIELPYILYCGLAGFWGYLRPLIRVAAGGSVVACIQGHGKELQRTLYMVIRLCSFNGLKKGAAVATARPFSPFIVFYYKVQAAPY
jgi:hypothetical protein